MTKQYQPSFENFITNFLSRSEVEKLAQIHGTPLFIYSKKMLQEQAANFLNLQLPFGHTIRYAMKANSLPGILKIFLEQGIGIDASSEFEAKHAIEVGFPGNSILLTSQQLAGDLKPLITNGVQFNATSLHQLEEYGKVLPGTSVGVRLNPGIGSGHSAKVTVGGITSSFGIWYKYISEIQELARRYQLTIKRLHTHIGCGVDASDWSQSALITLELIKQFPDVSIINLGGGFKVARMDDERGTDLAMVARTISSALKRFQHETGRALQLELEPGTLLVANSGILMASIEDMSDTGSEGYDFLKLNTGMNDILRPGMYGSQHPIAVINDSSEQRSYVVVGHNCESGDLLTPSPGHPEVLKPRVLSKASIGDLVLIGGAGAYCASMAAHGYNSFPSAQEIII